jgi:hypothetical protein
MDTYVSQLQYITSAAMMPINALLVINMVLYAERYPKRQLIPEWRQLVALILGVPKLELADDRTDPKYFDVSG